jgi:hypothetical protein
MYQTHNQFKTQRKYSKFTQEAKKNFIGNRPFVSATTHHEFFNPFMGLKQLAPVSPNAKSDPGKPPFRPTNGTGDFINPYPKFEMVKKVEEKAKGGEKKMVGVFKPGGVTGSYPIRSVLECKIPLSPPPWLKSSLREAMKI